MNLQKFFDGIAKDALIANKEVKNKKITVTVDTSKEGAVVKIADNGGGIKEEILDKIFDLYFTTKSEKGTGIGLHLVKMIIQESMKCRIRACNDKEGAAFEISLRDLLPETN